MQRGPLQANKGGNCTVFNETTDSNKLHLTSVVYEEHLACDSDQQTGDLFKTNKMMETQGCLENSASDRDVYQE